MQGKEGGEVVKSRRGLYTFEGAGGQLIAGRIICVVYRFGMVKGREFPVLEEERLEGRGKVLCFANDGFGLVSKAGNAGLWLV